jgi:hypothetical protein
VVIELCIGNQLRLLNGRTFGDSSGKFTCHTPMGNSIVDYVLASDSLLFNFSDKSHNVEALASVLSLKFII